MRFPARALLALAVLAPFAGHVAPASAHHSGHVEFQGAVTLPQYPCSGCSASFNASLASGSISDGTSTGTVTGLSASFSYAEVCVGGQATQGTAAGSAWISGVGSPLPMSVPFQWTRNGNVAVITGGGSHPFSGAALFMPVGGTPTCSGGSVTATITGAVVFVGQSVPPAPTVPPECSDGVDNDLDGRPDYGSDPGCGSADDPTENSDTPPSPDCPEVAGNPVCTTVTPGAVFQNVPVDAVTTSPGPSHQVVGAVDIYEFELPVGGTATVPCVVLTVDGAPDPCRAAGGTPGERVLTLVERTVEEPAATPGGTVVAVRICHATLTITVRGIGVNNVPGYALC